MFGAPRSMCSEMMQFVHQSHNPGKACITILPLLNIYPSESAPLCLACLSMIMHSSMVSPQS